MSRNFRTLLFILSIATILAIITSISPRFLSMYYQMEAAQILQNVMRNSKVNPDLGLPCESILVKQGKSEAKIKEAITKLNQAVSYNKENSQAFLLLGRAYCMLGAPDIAKDYYQAFTVRRPKNPLGYLGLGFAYEAVGDRQAAVAAWEEAGSTGQEFVETGFQHFDEGELKEAHLWFDRALLMDPELASAWIGIGKVNEEQRSLNNAIEAYQKAWEISPRISTTDYLRVLKRAGAQRKIVEVMTSALEAVPQSPDRLLWWRELGSALSNQGKWNEAKDILTNAIVELPHEPDLHIDLGWVIYKRGDGIEQAKQEFELAVSLDENSANGYFAIAQLYTREKRYREAEDYYEKAIGLAPDNRWFYTAQADNTRLAGELSVALNRYRGIISRFPDFSHAYYQMALAYRLNGQKQEAVSAIEQAIELMNSPLDNYYARAGDIYRWAGLKDKAKIAYDQALKLNPNNAGVMKSLERLGTD